MTGAAAAILFASASLIAGDAAAQAPPPASIARECQVTGATAIDFPLPNVAAALSRGKTIRILAIGAASTGGIGPGRGGYHATLRRMLKAAIKGIDMQIIHRGVSGELASQAARRIKLEVGLTAPDLVLWQVGTNDALSYVPVEEVERSVVGTIRWLRNHKVDVVLVGLQFVSEMARDSHYQAIRVALRRIAVEEKVVIVRRYEAMETLAKLERSDPGEYAGEFQRTEAAYDCTAQYVARAISVAVFGSSLRPSPPARP